ncbi:PWWP domain-containing protein 2A [Taenia solium]|eukprot:TsM_000288000 transcript=TsM_000288000 gene=TsM_000288000
MYERIGFLRFRVTVRPCNRCYLLGNKLDNVRRHHLMKLFLPSSRLPSRFDILPEQLELQGRDHLSFYERKDFSPTNTSRIIGYQKPKHLWMAKDHSLDILGSTSAMNNECPYLCSGSRLSNESRTTSEHVFASQQVAELTPLRNSYNGISPSNSSSAPGTVAMPSSLTNTSSSPSNHPSPQSRFGVSNISGSHYESPIASYPHQGALVSTHCMDSSEFKPKRKRGRPPKTKSDDVDAHTCPVSRKRQSRLDSKARESCSVPQPSTSSAFLTGGLKIRLRRDVSVDEPICGKKFRSRKSNQKSVQVFRIVESWCDADAPGGLAAKSNAVSPMSTNQTSGGFRVGDVVWAKLAGYPYWPSRISALYARTPHQLAQVSPENANSDSLAVSATPADPALAPGFTAKVEWFAWNQCSYLSCAKLFPFMEYFAKLYSPRTRVKNYAEAVNMAKLVVEGGSNETRLISEPQSDIEKGSSASLSLSNNTEHGRSDLSCPPDLHFAFNPLNEPKQSDVLRLPDLRLAFNPVNPQLPVGCQAPMENGHFSFLNLGANSGDFCQAPDQCWGPLPQLDVSGLNEFNSGVPTFSEDEDETSESLANQLKSELGSIGI